jgi:UDP-4-amino-4,6-dideoxy-N-acetyl-beta-L-altrosamine N-acetyltransferase
MRIGICRGGSMEILGKLRDIHDDELELMRSWRNAPTVRANMYTQHEITIDEHQNWWSKTRCRNDQQYFIYESDHSPRGIVGFMQIDRQNSHCSWAFYAAPDSPMGTGSKMEYLALEYVFGDLCLHKLYCEVLSFNVPVIKLHQKFGFQVEGVFRQHHLVNNEYSDIHRLGILKSEWTAHKDTMYNKLTNRK